MNRPARLLPGLLAAVVGLAAATATLAQTQPPNLGIALSPQTVGIGSCSELTITITNPDQAASADQLAVSLTLPAGVVFNNPALPVNECGGTLTVPDGGQALSLTGGSVAAATTCTIRVGVTLTAEGPHALTTSALSSSSGTTPGVTTTLDIPSNAPSLGFTKGFDRSPVQLGGQTTLTYRIENQSALEATAISFTDDLSPGIVVANTPNITVDCPGAVLVAIPGSQQVTFSGASLPAGQSCTLTLDVVGVQAGTNVSTSAELTSAFAGQNPEPSGRACAVLEVIPPEQLANLTFSKSFVDNPVDPGGTGDLQFTITNNSPDQTFTDIAFTDDLNETLPGLMATDLPTDGGILLEATFDGPTGGGSVLGATWNYLDRLENENGRLDGYPIDTGGNPWNAPDFDPVTSSVAGWQTGDAPLQGGVIDAFPPGTPSILGGIDTAPNGENLVTTYLFRQQFDLDAEQAASGDWLLDYLFDDGGIIYLNGVEVFRTPSMPPGVVDTFTLSGLGDETATASAPVDLSGLLVEGPNTIAVEVHQNTLTSSDVGFQLSLLPASAAPGAGFTYADDTFGGTNDPDFSSGTLDPAGGFAGGALRVTTGGKGFFSFLNPPSSGGWARTFTVDQSGVVSLRVRYRLVFSAEYEGDELSQALLEVDGVRFGNGPGGSLVQFTGGSGALQDSGWQTYTADLFLAAGEHTILVGAYNSKSSQATELTDAYFDDIQIGTPETPAPVCGPGSQVTGTDVLTLTGGALAPGQTCSFTVGVRVPVSTPTGTYRNTTSLLTTMAGGTPLVGLPAIDDLRVEPVPPTLTKTFSPASVAAGGVSTLTFTIDNTGSMLPASAVGFTDSLPAGLVVATPANAITTCTGGTLTAVPGSNTISLAGSGVAAGETCTVSVDVTAATPGEYLNTSSPLSSNLGESGPATATLQVSPPPLFSMAIAPASVNAGQVATLTYTIDNSASDLPATNLDFTNQLPPGLVLGNPVNFATNCIGGTINAGPGNGVVAYSGGTVPAGATCTLSVEVTSVEGGSYLNTAGDLTSDLGNSGPASASLEVRAIVGVTLRLQESADPVVAGSGARNLRYVLTATNAGPSTATGLVISQSLSLPPGVSLEQVAPSAGTYSAPLWSIPALPGGTSATLIVDLTAGPDAQAAADAITGTGTLTAVNEFNNVQGGTTVSTATSITTQIDLQLASTESSDPVVAGSGTGNLTHTLTVTNAGPSNASRVTLRLNRVVPAGATVDSITPSDGTIDLADWRIGDLAAGASETLTIVYTVGRSARPGADALSTSLSVFAVEEQDINPANDSTTIATTIANEVDIALTMTESIDPVLAGSGSENLVYTVAATNAGPSDANTVTVRNALVVPAGVTIERILPDTGSYAPAASPTGTWTFNLDVGETATLRVVLTVAADAPDQGTIANTTTLNGVLGTDLDPSNDTATEETTIVAGVDLVVTQDGPADPVIAGSDPGNLSFLVRLTNNGPLDSTNLEIEESLTFAEGITVDSIVPESGSWDGTVWSVPSLDANAETTLRITLSVGPSALPGTDVVTSNAAVSAVDQPQIVPGDEASTISASVERRVDLVVTVDESRDPVLAGFGLPENLHHTVTVVNLGPSDATDVTLGIDQQLAPGVLPVNVSASPGTIYTAPTWTVGELPRDGTAALALYLDVPASVPGGVDTIRTEALLAGAVEPLLNEENDRATIATGVVSPTDLAVAAGPIALDLQTALFRQTLTITNNNPLDLPAFRVLVDNLPSGVSVHNAQGDAGGRSYLLVNQPLAAGESIELVVEYFQLDASGGFDPTFEIELLDPIEPVSTPLGTAIDRIQPLPSGDILIEFSASLNGRYTIQYSDDGATWTNVLPAVLSGGTRRQWIDNGPPKTRTHPSDTASRLYRVAETTGG